MRKQMLRFQLGSLVATLFFPLFFSTISFGNQYLYEGSSDDGDAYYTRVDAPGDLSSWHARYLGCDPYRLIFFQNSHLGVVRLMRMSRNGRAFSVSNFLNVNSAIARMNYENNLDQTVNSFRCRYIKYFPRADFAIRVKAETLPLSVGARTKPTAFSKTLMGVGKYFSATTKVADNQVIQPSAEMTPKEAYQGSFDFTNPVIPRLIDSAQDVRSLIKEYSLDKYIAKNVLDDLQTDPPNPNSTVSMVMRNNEAQFYAFNTLGVLTTGLVLDGEKDGLGNAIVKNVPGNCTTCHGGTPIDFSSNPGVDNGKNVQAYFVPMDYNVLKFPKLINTSNPSLGYNLSGTYSGQTAAQKEILWRYNRAVSQRNTTIQGFQPTPNGFSPYIGSVLYTDLNDPNSALPGRVPVDYDNPTDKANYANGARQVGCVGCHQVRAKNWDSKAILIANRPMAKAYHDADAMPFSYHGNEVRDVEAATHCYVRKWLDPSLTLNCALLAPIDFKILDYPATIKSTQRPLYPLVSVPLE